MFRRDVIKAAAAVALCLATLTLTPASAKTPTALDSTTKFKNLVVSQKQAVLLLQINTPPRNTVSITTLREINRGLDIAERNENVGAVVITGTDQVFSAGAGGEGAQEKKPATKSHAEIARDVYARIERFPKPVIAAISGISAGGGNELAMACDIRIASKNAKFRQHELQAGLIPGFGGMQRLQRHIGRGRAMEMMLSGRLVDAHEALTIGLVSSVVAAQTVIAEAIKLGQQLTDNIDQHALAVFKERMAISYNEPYSVALQNDQLAFDRIANSEEAKEAIARFIEKQKAR